MVQKIMQLSDVPERFSEIALHKLSEEDADRVAGPFMRGVKGMRCQYDKQLRALLAAQCDALKIQINLEDWKR